MGRLHIAILREQFVSEGREELLGPHGLSYQGTRSNISEVHSSPE